VLHIRPWEWDLLSVDEADGLIAYIENRNAEIRRASG
jgi:hypothetical protein